MSIKKYESQTYYIEAIQLESSLENDSLVRKFLDGHNFEFAYRAKVGDFIIKTMENHYFLLPKEDFHSIYIEL